ncbi:MAG TPA: DivIVA domain-containing protein [Jiangellales bacterium]|nr:DivIVA domain-containing protein [Jiangellales bacterium]
MPLTPEDVQNKEFTTVRLREGYDMEEVDQFLDEVEAELARLFRENDELREKLAAVTRDGGVAGSVEPLVPQRAPEPVPVAPEPQAPVAAAAPSGGGAPHEAAAKVLALAQRTADELVADAKSEADQLLGDARRRADQLDSESKARAGQVEQDARMRADSLERETQQRRQELSAELEVERDRLEAQVEGLRAFEREYRSRLKAYLEGQLRQLETSGLTEAAAPASSTGPMRSVSSLLEDEQR